MIDRLRPLRLVVVTGTGTGCGKTWVASALIEHLRTRGVWVAARKPAQSFQPGELTDAELLGRASGEKPGEVCPRHRWYARPLAPPMAAEALGRPPFTMADLVAELVWPGAGEAAPAGAGDAGGVEDGGGAVPTAVVALGAGGGAPAASVDVADGGGDVGPAGADVGVVEGAGGVRSPLAGDGDIVDLAAAVEPDLVVLVAGPGLGTLNLVRLSADALAPWPLVVYLNRFDGADDLHRRNRDWIERRMGLAVDTSIGQLGRRLGGC